MSHRLTAALGLVAALALSGCAANEGRFAEDAGSVDPSLAALQGTLSGIGSSAQAVGQQTWIVGFQTAAPAVTINYSPEGSGAGREAFIGGGADFAGSDRAFTVEELEENTFGRCAPDSKAINLPVYISPIAVIFNVEGVDSLNLDAATIAGIFKGEITKWNDDAIAALNEGVELPDLNITAVHRSDTAGTTENFTDYLASVAPEVWDAEASGDWPYSGGEAAAQTQGVVSAVSGGVGAIGYVDASQAAQFSVANVGKEGTFYEPSTDAAAAIVENSPVETGREPNDMAIALDREAEGYPIVLVTYLIACQDYTYDETAELVKAYASYIISPEGQQAAAERAGSAPLSDGLSAQVQEAIDSIQ